MNFGNDYHVVLDFGMHKGKKIMDLPVEYIDWMMKNIRNKPEVTDAIDRITKRRGVTTIIRSKKSVPEFIPQIFEVSSKMEPIYRHKTLNPSMFGSFVEYMIKNYLGLSIDDEPRTMLSKFGLVEIQEHLRISGQPLEPDDLITEIHKRYLKQKRSIVDILYLSFSHSIEMNSFNLKCAHHLVKYVTENQDYFETYLGKLVLPDIRNVDQSTCDKISVGCVIGVIDMISEDSIIDIKCTQEDNLDYYRMQLFAYASLHHLRYGSNFTRCEIYNFVTGKQFVMPIGDSMKHAAEFIKSLSSAYSHQKLFK